MPSPSPGPRYEYHQDAQYLRRLDEEDVDTWYGSICKAAVPRGFARQDKESGPSAGDLVVTSRAVHEGAVRAFRDMQRGVVPLGGELDCLEVVVHEHTHCLVRLLPDGSDDPSDARIYGHPDKPVPAFLHAFSADCRFGVNAFTGLLRLRPSPRKLRDGMMGHLDLPEAWLHGMRWFGDHLDDHSTSYPAP